MSSSTGHTLQDACAVLRAKRICHVISASGSSLLALVRTERAKLSAEITIAAEEGCLTASAIYPSLIPEARRPALVEYLTRANAFEQMGSFVFDYDTGELVFAVTTLFDDAGFSDVALCRAIEVACARLDQHIDPVGLLLYREITPADALEMVYRFDLDGEVRRASNDL